MSSPLAVTPYIPIYPHIPLSVYRRTPIVRAFPPPAADALPPSPKQLLAEPSWSDQVYQQVKLFHILEISVVFVSID